MVARMTIVTIDPRRYAKAIDDAVKRLIRRSVQDWSEDSVFISPDPDANALHTLMVNGVRSVRVNFPTLKVSKLVSTGYSVKASLTNAGRIISTTTLETAESIPGTLLFNLPNYSTTKGGFVFGWGRAPSGYQ